MTEDWEAWTPPPSRRMRSDAPRACPNDPTDQSMDCSTGSSSLSTSARSRIASPSASAASFSFMALSIACLLLLVEEEEDDSATSAISSSGRSSFSSSCSCTTTFFLLFFFDLDFLVLVEEMVVVASAMLADFPPPRNDRIVADRKGCKFPLGGCLRAAGILIIPLDDDACTGSKEQAHATSNATSSEDEDDCLGDDLKQ
mmetsp:Transcript_105883/g.296393  ORF Transcript_105883/g.296393 Transcript_105883/m.296393 type:complete len:200 (-) Transcript_105883:133-732(-)